MPLPFVCNTCPLLPSEVGKVYSELNVIAPLFAIPILAVSFVSMLKVELVNVPTLPAASPDLRPVSIPDEPSSAIIRAESPTTCRE